MAQRTRVVRAAASITDEVGGGGRVPGEAVGAAAGGLPEPGSQLRGVDDLPHPGGQLLGRLGEQSGLAVDDRLGETADGSATLGVPRIAASITVRHQPSAEDAVSVTHARS